jgi:ubiquinone/menaquinone biosynthesis C-methylase UbiE
VTGFVNRFEGTASFYARYRPGYPEAVLDLLSRAAPLTTASSVLDLGCGPGSLALALAGRVRSVIGVDPDRGMLAEASRLAEVSGVVNARWILGTAEDFDGGPETCQLAVIGSAFHWMDQAAVADKVHRLLAPSGVLAVVDNPTPLEQIRRCVGVGQAIAEVQRRWFDEPSMPTPVTPPAQPTDVLRTSSFGRATLQMVPCAQEWDVERLIGFLRSTSWRPDQQLGERFVDFASEIDEAIRTVEPSGRWSFRSEVRVVLARR